MLDKQRIVKTELIRNFDWDNFTDKVVATYTVTRGNEIIAFDVFDAKEIFSITFLPTEYTEEWRYSKNAISYVKCVNVFNRFFTETILIEMENDVSSAFVKYLGEHLNEKSE